MGKKAKVLDLGSQTVTLEMESLDKIKLQAKKLSNRTIQWGYVNSRKYPKSDEKGRGGWYIAQQAAIHEYGLDRGQAGKMPKRAFFSQSISHAMIFLLGSKAAERALMHVFDGSDFEGYLAYMGEELAKTVKVEILQQDFKALSPFTQTKKAQANMRPEILRETDVMMDALSSKVVKRSLRLGGDK